MRLERPKIDTRTAQNHENTMKMPCKYIFPCLDEYRSYATQIRADTHVPCGGLSSKRVWGVCGEPERGFLAWPLPLPSCP